MTSQDLKFGTSGLRGPSRILDGEPAVRWANAFAQVMIDKGLLDRGGSVLLGRDLRASSPSILRYCARGLRLAGADPVDCGVLPTPALAAYAVARRLPAIMVTGSHIPEDRNGLKFYRPDGEIDKADEAAIAAAESVAGVLPAGETPALPVDDAARRQFVDRAISVMEPDALAGMKVGVFQHSSVMRDMLVTVLSVLGAETIAFGRSDIFDPIDTEAVRPEHLEICQKQAADHGLDAVVSTDGDADRPLVIDQNGNLLRGDLVGTVTAHMLGADCVVTPISSNTGIERCGKFARVIRTRIGSPFVIEGMRQAIDNGASTVVGFEANGGVLVGTDCTLAGRPLAALPTRDAMMPILAVLLASRSVKRPLSAIARDYAFADAVAGRLENVPAAKSGAFLAKLLENAGSRDCVLAGLIQVRTIDTTDGVRLKGDDGCIVHYRASGNAPELRCYVEAATPGQAASLRHECLIRARNCLEHQIPGARSA